MVNGKKEKKPEIQLQEKMTVIVNLEKKIEQRFNALSGERDRLRRDEIQADLIILGVRYETMTGRKYTHGYSYSNYHTGRNGNKR